MPQPKPVEPGQRIDPHHNGDGHAVHPPERDDRGRPIDQKPNRDQHGRDIPPGHDHIGRIDRPDIRQNIHGIQDHWDRNNHGYDWHDWNGMRVGHHYDEFGYHWWGFYVGSVYFWTRYHDDRYWWYDPYWARWDYLQDGQWWWQDDLGNQYVYNDGSYYRYDSGDSGVIMTPDPTPPVEAPPADPDAPAPSPDNQSSVYSLDGTRSVQVTGDNRDAYLYDLTQADPQSDAAQGRYLGTGVAGVEFVYDTQTADDGTTTQTIRQIKLTYDDPSASSIVDVNGQRRVDVAEDAQNATLVNLIDSSVDPAPLASGVTDVTFVNQQQQDDSGETVTSLQLIVLATTDADGNQATLTFDQDGASVDGSTATPDAPQSAAKAVPPTPAPAAIKTLDQKLEGSETFRALKAGVDW